MTSPERSCTSSPDVRLYYHFSTFSLSNFAHLAPPDPNSAAPTSPQGTVPSPFTFKLSQVAATQLQGGSVKIADSSTFTVAKTIAVAEVTVEPGAMRELHWHPTQDEWTFFL